MTLLTLLAVSTIEYNGTASVDIASATVTAQGSRDTTGSAAVTAASALDLIAGRLYSGTADVEPAGITVSDPVGGLRGGIGIIDITASGTTADAAGERGPSQGSANVTDTATITAPGFKGGIGTSAVDPGLHTVDRAGAKTGEGSADSAAADSTAASGVLGGEGTATTTTVADLAAAGAKDVSGTAGTQASSDSTGSGGQDRSGTADVTSATSAESVTGRMGAQGTASPISAASSVTDTGVMPPGAHIRSTEDTAASGSKDVSGSSPGPTGFNTVGGRGGRAGVIGSAATSASSSTASDGNQGRHGAVSLSAGAYLNASGNKLTVAGTAAMVNSSTVSPPTGKKRMAAPFAVIDAAIVGNPGYSTRVGTADVIPAGSDTALSGGTQATGAVDVALSSATAGTGDKTAVGADGWTAASTAAAAGTKAAAGSAALHDTAVLIARSANQSTLKQLATIGVG